MRNSIKLPVYIALALAVSAIFSLTSPKASAAGSDEYPPCVVGRDVDAEALTLEGTGDSAVVNAGRIGVLTVGDASPKRVRICGGVEKLVISGSGVTVTVVSAVSSVTVSGEDVTVLIPWGGRAGRLVLTEGSRGCVVNVYTSAVDSVELSGGDNVLNVNAAVGRLVLDGAGCSVAGRGSVGTLVLRTYRSSCALQAGSTVDERPTGLGDLDMDLSTPEAIRVGEDVTASATLKNPFDIDCTADWFVNGRKADTQGVTVGPEGVELRLTKPLIYDSTVTDDVSVRLTVSAKSAAGEREAKSLRADVRLSDPGSILGGMTVALSDAGCERGRAKVRADIKNDFPAVCTAFWYVGGAPVTSRTVSVGPEGASLELDTPVENIPANGIARVELKLTRDRQSASRYTDVNVGVTYEEALATVTHKYAGDRTLEWALEHDYDENMKTAFVNAKGYESATDRLIWVNLTYQRVNVFKGSKGKWVLEKCFLCGTGAPGSGTPVGEYTTWYSQPNGWNHGSYIVRPVVRFYAGTGYAFHSRLWNPSHTRLVDARIGFPISAGCVRMYDEDAYWMLDNIVQGTKVVIH